MLRITAHVAAGNTFAAHTTVVTVKMVRTVHKRYKKKGGHYKKCKSLFKPVK